MRSCVRMRAGFQRPPRRMTCRMASFDCALPLWLQHGSSEPIVAGALLTNVTKAARLGGMRCDLGNGIKLEWSEKMRSHLQTRWKVAKYLSSLDSQITSELIKRAEHEHEGSEVIICRDVASSVSTHLSVTFITSCV